MTYSNPEVPHDVNVTPIQKERRILWYFLSLLAGIIVVFITLRFLLPFIPFEYERRLTVSVIKRIPTSEVHKEAESYLLQLANQLAINMDVPPHYSLNIIVTNDSEKNAFATFGGNIIITRGLINLIESENALSMVLGHEIAHIKNRDPIRSAGSRLFLQIMFSLLSGASETSSLNSLASITDNTFSRQQESNADALALCAVQKHYGHTQGAEEFFEKIDHLPFGIEFLSTHPKTDHRLKLIYASQKDSAGKLTPLPKVLNDLSRRP